MSLFTSNPDLLTVHLYTNRQNLVDFLSSGLLKPAGHITKYYADAGRLAPDHLLLWLVPPPAAVLEAEREDVFPVALTLQLPRSAGKLPVLRRDGTISERKLDAVNPAMDLAVLVPGALPITWANTLVFRSARDRERFEEVAYRNVGAFEGEIDITPAAFENGPTFPDQTLEAYGGATDALRHRRTDRMLGAAALALWAFERSDGAFSAGAAVALVTTARPLETRELQAVADLREALVRAVPAASEGEPHWLALFPHLWREVGPPTAAAKLVPSVLKAFPRRNRPTLEIAELALLAATVEQLSAVVPHDPLGDPPPRPPIEVVLREIAQRFEAFITPALPRKSADDPRPRYRAAFDHIARVLAGERDLSSLRNWPVGTETVKSLLLFALRPEPAACWAWRAEPESTFISPGELTLALMFAGLRRGYEALDRNHRPVGEGAPIFVDLQLRLVAEHNPLLRATLPEGAPPTLEVAGGHLTPKGLERRLSLWFPGGDALTLRGQDDLAAVLAELAADSLSKGQARDAARLIAERCGWDGAFTHVIELTGVPFKLESSGRKTLLRLERALDLQAAVRSEFSAAEFHKRLAEAGDTVPFDVRLDAARLLGHQVPVVKAELAV